MFDGPILPLTIKIGMPILIGNVMQFCYALADTIFIARIDPSSTAIISGTGLMFPLFFVFMAISMSMSIGTAALVGRLIGANDLMIASTALAHGLIVVTHNTEEFRRIDGLAVEDWQG